MRYPKHGSFMYRLLAILVWKPYYWIIYRQEPELRVFMIRRRIWGGHVSTAQRARFVAALDAFRDAAKRGR